MIERQLLLNNWLISLYPEQAYTLEPASADASFRRYFRARFTNHSLVVMDAPPQHEDCRPFIHVAQLFSKAGVHVPEVIAQDLAQGFLLLSDLGDTTYLQALNADNPKTLYGDACNALINIQLASRENVLPVYDETMLMREMRLFPEWYIAKHLQTTLSEKQAAVLATVFQRIVKNNLAQPRVWVHRDYHSRNLMVSTPNPGILDFQDAVYGPITYDLASLFKDAYIGWREADVLDWLIRYWEGARTATMNGWAYNVTLKCWASLRACHTVTAKTAT
jgi:N-acetylmuramate 1-kinase